MNATQIMQWATWLTVIVLGPGAVAVFVWFVIDLVRMGRAADDPEMQPPNGHSGTEGR